MRPLFAIPAALLALAACSAPAEPPPDTLSPADILDAGTEVHDAGTELFDAGTEVSDARHDAGTEVHDAVPDGGTEVHDAVPDAADLPPDADGPSCDCPAPTVTLTVNAIPGDMNGSVPYLDNNEVLQDFHLALPTFGFRIDVTLDSPCGEPGFTFSVDSPAGEQPAGTDLAPLFDGDGGARSLWVGEEMTLPEGWPVTLLATATDPCGQTGEASLAVETVTLTPMLHPFDLEDPWLFVYHRDHYTIDLVIDGPDQAHVEALEVPNGIDDFVEDLWTVGIGSASPTAAFAGMACEGGTGGSECLARHLLDRVRQKAYKPFHCAADGSTGPDSVPIRFLIEGEPGAPDPGAFEYQYLDGTESSRRESLIGFGGGDLSESWIGMSESIDVHNTHNENNARFGYGCFTTSLVRYFYQYITTDPELYALAQLALADLLPAMGGIPVGELEGDELVADFTIPKGELAPLLQKRRLVLDTALDVLAAGLAALTAHEIGHSLGLVAKAPPPYGLFGGVKYASFIENPAGSAGAHIDTAGPNLMQAGPGSGNMDSMDIEILLTPFFFNELNLAYLQGRIVVK